MTHPRSVLRPPPPRGGAPSGPAKPVPRCPTKGKVMPASASMSEPESVWRAPTLSMRWWPVFLRNLLVWRKLAVPSLIGNIAEPLIWLVAFGYGMGALVGEVQVGGTAVPYILFLASGSVCMSAMNAASFEALYSAFSRMHVQKTWDGIMNAPVGSTTWYWPRCCGPASRRSSRPPRSCS